MDINSFIINTKTEDFYEYTIMMLKKRFLTSNYGCNSVECNRPLPTGKNEKVIGLMKDELGGKIMTKFFALILT